MEERIQKSYQKISCKCFSDIAASFIREIIGVLPCQDSFYYQTSSILVNADRYCQCNQCSFIERFFSVAGHLFQRFFDGLSDWSKIY